MKIITYETNQQEAIYKLLKKEKWDVFIENFEIYQKALLNSITLVAVIDHEVVGYIRAISDQAFLTFIAELIVDQKYRRQGIAKKLIETIKDITKTYKLELITDEPELYKHANFEKVAFGLRKVSK